MDRQTSISTIRTLSYFLSNFTTGKPIPRDRNKNGHLSFLNHISTMLNTGTPPSLVLAVTGQISPTNFEAAVVVSSNSNEDDKFQSSYDITKVEPSNMSDESIRNPSSLGKSNGPPFQQHLCDVAGILRLLSQSPDPAELSNRLLFWLIVQCRKRIATRFRLGTKVWTSAPWKVMEDWSPNANDALASPDIDISEPFRKGLSECGFPANGDGVHHWIHCLGKLLSAAHQLRNKNDKASLVKLRSCLTCVETILESSEVKRIFRESSLSEGFKSKPKTQHDVPKTDNAEVDYEEVAADESEEEFDMTFEENEEPGSRALRYILTLVAWHKATRAVIQVADLAIKVQKLPEICLVRLADYSSDAVDDVKTNSQGIVDSLNAQIADEYANDEEAGRSISQWIEEQCIMPNTIWPYRVHAEAGLMALLKMVQEGSVDFGDEPYKSTIKFFEEVRECTIGASKKCCYMCHLLGEYMFNESSENLTPTIHLPGTHGHVFPWDPPSFGIPDTILDKLAQKLRQDIIRLAVNNASTITNRSGQSSPTSDSGDRRRVSFTYTWD